MLEIVLITRPRRIQISPCKNFGRKVGIINVLINLSWRIIRAQMRQDFESWQEQCTLLINVCNSHIDLPIFRNVAESMNIQWTSPVTNSVMHWRILTFLDVTVVLLYTVHCTQTNALILVESLVIFNVFGQREVLFWLLRWRRINIMCTRRSLLLSIQGKLCWDVLENSFELICASWENICEQLYRKTI